MSKASSARRTNARLAAKLALVAVAMFGFGYALTPLYNLFCEIAGINGKVGRAPADIVAAAQVDQSRVVTVEFTGHAASGLPWEFRPMTKKLQVHPGEAVVTSYYARNTASEPITGQAVPSVTPGRAAPHFKKIECFCFTEQKLAPGEAREMPVRFIVTPGLSPEVHTITLSYAFFNIDKTSARRYGSDAAPPDHHQMHVPATAGKG